MFIVIFHSDMKPEISVLQQHVDDAGEWTELFDKAIIYKNKWCKLWDVFSSPWVEYVVSEFLQSW